MDERVISDGARALRVFLNTKNISVPDFCETHGLDRIQVQKALKGEIKRISVDLALNIERATESVVKAHGWREETRRPSTVERKPRKSNRDDDTEIPPVGDLAVRAG